MESLRKAFTTFWDQILELIPGFVVGLLVIVVFFLLARNVRALVTKAVSRYNLDKHTVFTIGRFTNIGVASIGVVIGLGVMGVNLTALIATIGLVGFAVGFALQGILSNFLAGVTLMIQRPFSIGDAIAIGSTSGIVTDIRLRDTVLRTFDGLRVVIPNQTVFSQVITNFTASGRRRLDIPLSLGHEFDLSQASHLATEAVLKVQGALTDPAPHTVITRFTDSAVEFELRFWFDSRAVDIDEARSKAWKEVRDALHTAGLKVRAAR